MTAAKVVGVDGPTQVPLHVSEEHRGHSNLERAGLCTMPKDLATNGTIRDSRCLLKNFTGDLAQATQPQTRITWKPRLRSPNHITSTVGSVDKKKKKNTHSTAGVVTAGSRTNLNPRFANCN